jgi:hypothetical protein
VYYFDVAEDESLSVASLLTLEPPAGWDGRETGVEFCSLKSVEVASEWEPCAQLTWLGKG